MSIGLTAERVSGIQMSFIQRRQEQPLKEEWIGDPHPRLYALRRFIDGLPWSLLLSFVSPAQAQRRQLS